MISENSLFETILEVAIRENKHLQEIGKGIFFIPELAFTYICGKSIMSATSIFGLLKYDWIREKQFKNYGFADLVFEPREDGPEIVIEFKMDNTYHKYLEDVKKLQMLKGNYRKFFCGLKWVFVDQVQEFLETLRNNLNSELIDYKDFGTIVNENKRKDRCLLSLWEIKGD